VCVGLVASIQAEIWMAHSVSPISSGGFVSIIILVVVGTLIGTEQCLINFVSVGCNLL
jgi:hypothetical protein